MRTTLCGTLRSSAATSTLGTVVLSSAPDPERWHAKAVNAYLDGELVEGQLMQARSSPGCARHRGADDVVDDGHPKSFPGEKHAMKLF